MTTNGYFSGLSSAAAPTAVENPLRGGGRRGSLKVGCALLVTLAVLSCYGGDGSGPLAPDAEHEPELPTVFPPFPAAAAEQADDRQHLTDLYNATGGNNWTDRTNWLDSTAALNDWYGVTASSVDEVTTLWLHSNNLEGALPGGLGGLAHLDTLNVGMNELTGAIPAELGNSSSLRVLFLQRNQFSGTIPAELGDLSELVLLNVRYNQLTGTIPAELGNLTNIQILNLKDNQFTGEVPSELTSLTTLRRFLVGGNTSLCRPDTATFTDWLNGIDDTDALDLPTCDPPPPTKPDQPTGLEAETDADTPAKTIELSFAETSDAVAANTQYRVRGRESGASWTAWATLSGVTTSDGKVSGRTSELAVGKAYEVQVRACGDTQSDEACSDASASAFGATASASPTGVSAGATSPASTSALVLSWTIEGASDHHDAGYDIGYSADTTDTAPATTLDADDVPALTESEAEVSGLDADTEYRLFIRTHVSWDGQTHYTSPWAAAAARTEPPPPTKPDQPTGLEAETDADTPAKTIELSFAEASDAVAANTQYRVKGRESGASWTAWATLSGVTTSDGKVSGRTSELAVGKAYEVQVRVCGDTQSDEACSDASASAFGATASASPTGVSAGATSPASTSALALSWTIEGAADHHDAAYDIGYSADTTDTAPATTLDTADVPAFTDSTAEVTGLDADTEYRLFIRTRVSWDGDSYYTSPWAPATARTESEAPTKPAQPTGLETETDADTPAKTMELSFAEASDAVAANTQYRVRGREENASWTAWATLSGVTTSDGKVNGRTGEQATGKAYELQVRACGDTQSDEACSDASASAFGATASASPTGVSARAASPASDTALQLSWTLEGAADHHDAAYDIGYSADTAATVPAATLDTADVPALTDSAAEVSGLDADTEYRLFIRTRVSWDGDSYYTSAWASATARTEPEPTEPPTSNDRATLAQLYNATGGSSWTNRTNWLDSTAALNDWYGVGADGSDIVSKLWLGTNNLSGALAGALGGLSGLDTLNVGGNRLSGSLPSELGDLSNLVYMSFWNNDLTGEIPADLGSLSELTHLSVSANEISGGVPVEIGNLTKLEGLYLYDNKLAGALPSELTALTSLRRFLVRDNTSLCRPDDSAFTAWLNNIDDTDALDLPTCASPPPDKPAQPEGLETETDADTPVKTMKLSFTEVEGAVAANTQYRVKGRDEEASWTEWATLAEVSISDGSVTGRTEEQEMGKAYELQIRVCGETQSDEACSDASASAYGATASATPDGVSAGPSSPASDSALVLSWTIEGAADHHDAAYNIGYSADTTAIEPAVELDAADTPSVTDSAVAVEVTGLEASTEYRLFVRTRVMWDEEGYYSSAWTSATARTEPETTEPPASSDREILIQLYNSTGGDSWRTSTNWLDSLAALDTWAGVTANEAGEVTALQLNFNRLTGSIPAELGGLGSLKTLHLQDNELDGAIPAALGGLDSLMHLRLSGNRLTGAIPGELGNLSALKTLILNGNELTGAIPDELGNLSSLDHLYLHGNQLTGTIPGQLGDLAALRVLYLHNNQLMGEVPAELGALTSLWFLRLGNNDLTGELPVELASLDGLQIFMITGNYVCRPPSSAFTTWLEGVSGTDPIDVPICYSDTNPNPRDREALTSLFADAGGTSWTTRTNWLDTEVALNQWYGVTADSADQVSVLRLANNGLSGTLSVSLGKMGDLDTLDLRGNELSGPIPAGFQDLAGLESFLVTGNSDLCRPDTVSFGDWLDRLGETDATTLSTCTNVVHAEAAHLNQANQNWDATVRMVAGRPALLRVFLTGDVSAGTSMPEVRATFYQSGTETYSVTERVDELPWDLTEDEEDYYNLVRDPSWDVVIPDSIIQPGLEFVIEVDPSDEIEWGAGSVRRIPATGRKAITVTTPPSFKHVIVPTYQTLYPDGNDEVQAWADTLTVDHPDLTLTRWVWPINEYELEVRDAFTTDADLRTASGWGTWLNEIAALRTLEKVGGYYYGATPRPPGSKYGGLGFLGYAASVGTLNPYIIAHETGHNLGRLHARGCTAGFLDKDFPNPHSYTEHWGYDPFENELQNPQTNDVMGYCWGAFGISVHNYEAVLDHRLPSSGSASSSGGLGSGDGSPQPGLLVWGRVTDGQLILEPTFFVEAPASLPERSGRYRVSGTGPRGTVFSVSFDPRSAILEGDPSDAQPEPASLTANFAFVIPMDASQLPDIERIALNGPEGQVTMSANQHAPMAMLRDRRTGQVRAFLRDWAGALPDSLGAGVQNLSISISRGIPR